MSRIGKKPISVPAHVTVAVAGRTVSVEGPKGKLSWTHHPDVTVAASDGGKTITVTRRNDERGPRELHGTTRTLIANMIEGCLNGYAKKLEVYGVGYSVQLQGDKLSLTVGYAGARVFTVPPGITVTVQTPQARGETEPARFTVAGADKHMVGEFASQVRRCRKPEPYKGKGIRYAGEYVRRKAGKAFAGAGTT